MEYTRWLSQATGKSYRLATEAEWEYAARAGTSTPYSFGGDAKAIDGYAWYAANAGDRPHPVGQKKPNPFGLHDMHGNVAEWCLDQYAPDFYARSPSKAPVLLPSDRRYPDVARGGSWADDAKQAAKRRPARIDGGLEPARPSESAKHLVAHRRDDRRVPHRRARSKKSPHCAACGRR